MHYTFHWRPAFQVLPDMLWGALVTLQVAVLSMIFGVFLAVLLALASRSRFRALQAFSVGWVELARNTPALFQIYMAYFGLGSLGIFLDSFPALLAGMTFNNAGYLAETFRGGLHAVPETQIRAARSLGMGPIQAFRLIVLPQLFRVVFHPLTNQMVWSILMTSLGVIVGLNNDLMGVTQDINVKSFRTFEVFSIAAVIYYVTAKVVTGLARLMAWRLFRY
ncbi:MULTISPECIES: amino acid ABC transporter permease [unclassified Mesorhizobium]|uniref:amino acid ABC transporter permease n=1 Tax=unclassified Mesorhizobium TaxID=325217 RepID=UPI001092D063|nr:MULTISPECIES: amino acid ABC transporter permease [unclassified Mesorhizobium]TGS43755.1 amino acid ABC transporter permease [Mesorhizobium sp. M8A.F.Ca.ET.182.01.1.1]TGS78336.1 amino acid ABC transporter permease [Mesorhizobium sp. M8A.F.Ca.ET.181.01.1.1]TGV15474.1 amino acid ABC transporter permease [Mesorhizobium sp. M8A.F.Ca.ET.173.01.1.1]